MIKKQSKNKIKDEFRQRGFSLPELIIVLLIISILSVLSIMSIKTPDLYDADYHAFALTDILQEARQKALTQRKTMRVEISKTQKLIRLIAENNPGTADDDKLIRSVTLDDNSGVIIGETPANIRNQPVEQFPIPNIIFKPSVYTPSQLETVATLRFLRNGRVVDAGANAVGDNAATTGATIFVWTPNRQNQTTGNVLRAITVIGNSGAVRYWKCPVNETGICGQWTR